MVIYRFKMHYIILQLEVCEYKCIMGNLHFSAQTEF